MLAEIAMPLPLTDAGAAAGPAPAGRHARLLAAAAAGDAEALGTVLREEAEVLHRVCARLLGDREDGLDAFQEGCLRIQRALPSYDPSRPARPWLMTMCVRAAQDLRRKRTRRRGVFALFGADAPPVVDRTADPDAEAAGRELGGLLTEALDRLPPRERDAFALVQLEGLEVAAVASMLGVRPSTVRGHCLQARRKLQRFLARRAPELLP